MNIYLRTYAGSEGDNGGLDIACVEMTQELASIIIRRAALFKVIHKEQPYLDSLNFWDASVSYHEIAWSDERGSDLLDLVNDGPVWSAHAMPESTRQRTECDRMIVDNDTVCWICYPKHGDITVETAIISLAELHHFVTRIREAKHLALEGIIKENLA